MGERRGRPARRRAVFKLLAVLSMWGAIEAICHAELGRRLPRVSLTESQLALVQQVVDARGTYLVASPELGWEIAPSTSSGPYRSNSAGLRADREYAAEPPPGVVRAVIAGDSFTHGDEVELEETWARALERRLRSLEVLNLGVCGYGPDQALLRFRRDGLPRRPRLAIFGVNLALLFRLPSTFRPMYEGGLGFGKPRFVVDGQGSLQLIENPLPSMDHYRRLLADPERELPRVVAHDDYYRRASVVLRWGLPSLDLARLLLGPTDDPMMTESAEGLQVIDPRSSALRVLVAIARAFDRDARSIGCEPVIVVFPLLAELPQLRARGPSHCAAFIEELERVDIHPIDMSRLLPPDAFTFRPGGHYDPPTNDRVAQALLEELERRAPDLVSEARRAR